MNADCFICQKHAGHVAPPGGYIYADEHWRVCHAPATMAPLGTLIVESQRHFLDFAEMEAGEAASYGPLLQRLYGILKLLVGAERVYNVVMLEGAAHFHAWLVPRPAGSQERGYARLTGEHSCDETQAAELAERLREIMHQ